MKPMKISQSIKQFFFSIIAFRDERGKNPFESELTPQKCLIMHVLTVMG